MITTFIDYGVSGLSTYAISSFLMDPTINDEILGFTMNPILTAVIVNMMTKYIFEEWVQTMAGNIISTLDMYLYNMGIPIMYGITSTAILYAINEDFRNMSLMNLGFNAAANAAIYYVSNMITKYITPTIIGTIQPETTVYTNEDTDDRSVFDLENYED